MNNAADLPNIFPLVIDFLKSGVVFHLRNFYTFSSRIPGKVLTKSRARYIVESGNRLPLFANK